MLANDADVAADAARSASGGRVLGIRRSEKGDDREYRVRVLQPDGRVRNWRIDGRNGQVLR